MLWTVVRIQLVCLPLHEPKHAVHNHAILHASPASGDVMLVIFANAPHHAYCKNQAVKGRLKYRVRIWSILTGQVGVNIKA